MISRRYIRVKVMQTLYVLETMDNETIEQEQKQGLRILEDKFKRTFDLFSTCLLYIVRVAQFAETYAQQKANKYLPSAEDLNVNTKIAQNTFMLQLLNNPSFQKRIKDANLEQYVSGEWVKKVFQRLVDGEHYKEYLATENRTAKSEKNIIRYIWFGILIQNEQLMEYFNDELPGWEDDATLMMNLLENFFHTTPEVDFFELISLEKKKYAHDLLITVIEKKEYCMSLIQPRLQNWDTERIAIVDLLLLCMGITELQFFETIPTKVTINEYIEISKLYSTRQSGPFINGVLDNIYKNLLKEDKIHKIDISKPKPPNEA